MSLAECDEWEASTNSNGYGKLVINSHWMLAHRLVWMQTFGNTDLLVLHSCDNRSCINLDHLRTGTHQDNMRDMKERGRGNNQRKTHCLRGHEFTPENTYHYPRNNRRLCRTCHNTYKNRRNKNDKSSETKGVGV